MSLLKKGKAFVALLLLLLVTTSNCKKSKSDDMVLVFMAYLISITNTTPVIPPTAPNYKLPIEVATTSSAGSIDVKWKPATGVTSYKVSYVNGSSTPVEQTGITSNTVSLTGLKNGSSYTITVTSENDLGAYEGTATAVPSSALTYISYSPVPTNPVLFDGKYFISADGDKNNLREGAVSTNFTTWSPLPLKLYEYDYHVAGSKLYFLKEGSYCSLETGVSDIFCANVSLDNTLSAQYKPDLNAFVYSVGKAYYDSAEQIWYQIFAENSSGSYNYMICSGASLSSLSACSATTILAGSLEGQFISVTDFIHVTTDTYMYCKHDDWVGNSTCYRTVDKGQNWTTVSELTGVFAFEYTIEKLNNGNLLLKSFANSFYATSTDNGASWTQLPAADAQFTGEYGDKFAHDSNMLGKTMYKYVTVSGVHKSGISSSNDLVTWNQGTSPATITYIKAFTGSVPPVLLKLSGTELSRSADDGANWTVVNTVTNFNVVAYKNYLYVNTATGMQYSNDKGITWLPVACVAGSRTCPALAANISFNGYSVDPADVEPPLFTGGLFCDAAIVAKNCMFHVNKLNPAQVTAFGSASALTSKGVYDASGAGYLLASGIGLFRYTYVNPTTDFSYLNIAAANIYTTTNTQCTVGDVFGSTTAWYMGNCATNDKGTTWVDSAVRIPKDVSGVTGAQISLMRDDFYTSPSFQNWNLYTIYGVELKDVSQAAGDMNFYLSGSPDAIVKVPASSTLGDY